MKMYIHDLNNHVRSWPWKYVRDHVHTVRMWLCRYIVKYVHGHVCSWPCKFMTILLWFTFMTMSFMTIYIHEHAHIRSWKCTFMYIHICTVCINVHQVHHYGQTIFDWCNWLREKTILTGVLVTASKNLLAVSLTPVKNFVTVSETPLKIFLRCPWHR